MGWIGIGAENLSREDLYLEHSEHYELSFYGGECERTHETMSMSRQTKQ